jgi:hypothetical protein
VPGGDTATAVQRKRNKSVLQRRKGANRKVQQCPSLCARSRVEKHGRLGSRAPGGAAPRVLPGEVPLPVPEDEREWQTMAAERYVFQSLGSAHVAQKLAARMETIITTHFTGYCHPTVVLFAELCSKPPRCVVVGAHFQPAFQPRTAMQRLIASARQVPLCPVVFLFSFDILTEACTARFRFSNRGKQAAMLRGALALPVVSISQSPTTRVLGAVPTRKKATAIDMHQRAEFASKDKNVFLTVMNVFRELHANELKAKDEVLKAKDDTLNEVKKAKDDALKAKDGELKAKDDALKAKDGVLKAKDEVLKAKDGVLEAKDGELKAKDEVLKAKDDMLKAKDSMIQKLEQETVCFPFLPPHPLTIPTERLQHETSRA